jgi:hypothetical protein
VNVLACTVILAKVGNLNRRIKVQTSLSKKQDPISKIARVKRAGSMIRVIENLASKLKALSSNPSTAKKSVLTMGKKKSM